jgi:hypothetical protein
VGSLNCHLDAWKSITSDAYVLACVSGFKLEFSSLPFQTSAPFTPRFNKSEREAIDLEVIRLLQIGAIKRCSREKGDFVSHIFPRKKANGKIRVILNLKPLNQFLSYEHFKMEHIEFVCDLICKNDWLGSIDMTDAYFSVPVHESHWKYLKFYWSDKLYCYKVLCFGMSQAPRIFTRICKPILAFLRGERLIRCSLYIDDMIIMNASRLGLRDNLNEIIRLLTSLGFQINEKKSVVNPTQMIAHLGVMVDSRVMTLSMTQEKMTHIEAKCQEALKSAGKIKIREVASLVGTFVSAYPATNWGKLHYRKLENEKTKALRTSYGNFDEYMSISNGLEDIKWWLSTEKSIPKPIVFSTPNVTMYSDASLAGWGAHTGSSHTGGRWGLAEQGAHINWLELKACWLALQSFVRDLEAHHVMVRLDNTCAVAYINNQGGVTQSLNALACDIWEWCKSHNIWLSAKHVPGTDNELADLRSRVFRDNTEWSLQPKVFKLIVEFGGMPTIDLFASRLNFKVEKFISWEPDPLSFETDAFSVNWGDLGLCYVFPPFELVGRVLSKIRRDKANVLLVVPDWQSQYWYPMLREMSQGLKPLRLHMKPNTVYLPYNPDTVHPIWRRLNLMCCRVSGK